MRAVLLTGWILAVGAAASAQQSDDVSPRDVKRFIDPTTLINSVDYSFKASFLPLDAEAYTHTVGATWAQSHWSAAWVDIPITHFSFPGQSAPSGVGDVVLGWGGILHEDLDRRLTASLGAIEVVVPTGTAAEGTGTGRFVLAPLGAIALNPTDLFPVYITGQYFQSIGDGGESDGVPVRALELSVETAHILPKGFYVSAIPTLFFDLEQDVNFLSIGVSVGRALTRNFAWGAGYVHYVAGRKTFSQGFSFGLNYIWGDEKTASP